MEDEQNQENDSILGVPESGGLRMLLLETFDTATQYDVSFGGKGRSFIITCPNLDVSDPALNVDVTTVAQAQVWDDTTMPEEGFDLDVIRTMQRIWTGSPQLEIGIITPEGKFQFARNRQDLEKMFNERAKTKSAIDVQDPEFQTTLRRHMRDVCFGMS